MDNNDLTHTYLRAILQVTARRVFQPDRLRKLVSPGGSEKLIRAYSLCDGTRGQKEIYSEVGLSQGTFSSTVSEWEEKGIMYRVGKGKKEEKLLHLYPLSVEPQEKKTNKKEQTAD